MGHFSCRHCLLENLDVRLGSSIVDMDPLVTMALPVRSCYMKRFQHGLHSNTLWSANRPMGCTSGTPALKRLFLPEDVAFQKTHV